MTAHLITASIVTFHTDLEMLKSTISSLKSCALPTELVIADNTPEAAYFATLQALPNARCVASPGNPGYGAAHNLALAHSPPSAYHLILNPDVIIHPGCLERLVALMEAQPDIVLAVPQIRNEDGSLQPLNKRNPDVLAVFFRRFMPAALKKWGPVRRHMERFIMMDYGYDQPNDAVCYASGCFMLFRRNTLEAMGGFDERFFMYFEDADITRRARMLGRVHYCPEAVITHAWARGSYTSWRLMLVTIASAYRYFQKWGWRLW